MGISTATVYYTRNILQSSNGNNLNWKRLGKMTVHMYFFPIGGKPHLRPEVLGRSRAYASEGGLTSLVILLPSLAEATLGTRR
jgi:hypothetical protein